MSKKVKKPPITITELLSINRTADCRRLLKANGMPDATSHADLQNKLVELYRNTPDKRELEKQIAELHPHREFILKYLPVKDDIKVQPVTDVDAKTKVIANEWAGTEGNRNAYNQKYLCACGCGGSSFDGTGPNKFATIERRLQQQNTLTIIVGTLVAVGLIGAIIHYSKQLYPIK